ncbi:hypothetical protein OSB04_017056 [Centaurea solstitialis]|uniref:BED-type domain-containing protein n=1 Tax=Centaurea solstitialis TaxID=347529 RepID=A0AA38WLP6_9ASTR|nr:hypothetical protein OSB04_017056 [Centaurea solstitialis]
MELTASSMASTACQELKRKSTDVGWEYGVLVDPNKIERVKCLLCGKEMGGGINRLKYHIANITGNVKPCLKSTKEDLLKCRNALNEVTAKKKGKQDDDNALREDVSIGSNELIDIDEMDAAFGSIGNKPPRSFGPMDKFATMTKSEGKSKHEDAISSVVRKEMMIRAKEYICRWAYECAIPFHAFGKDSFKRAAKAIGQYGPRLPPPTRYEMGDTYLKKEVEKTKSTLKKYQDEWKSSGCTIMTDAWSDRKRRSIMNLCVNSRLGTVFLSSKEFSDVAHTSEYVDKCIDEVGHENVVQIVTDNASNNMGAAKLLKLKRPKIFWTSCAAHTVNLMLEAIGEIQRYKKVLLQAKKFTVFVYAHHKTLSLMRHFTKKRDIVRPGVTRFASTFLTLQSLAAKKSQLRQMFTSEDWDKCKFSKAVKGKAAYATVVSPSFWAGITLCLKVFAHLVKVLRMVDADWKPSMGFIYGELKKAKKEIIDALGNNKNAYEPVIGIIEAKMKDRLDTCLHLTAYLLNPFYLYNNEEAQNDVEASDAIIEVVGILHPEEYELQNHILAVKLPMYKRKLGKFDRIVAIKGCEVNDAKYDPANWWAIYGSSTLNLQRIATRILSLTTSSSGCERNWSTFEGVHTKKRNRLETTKVNNLVFVQFNANLMEKNQKRKERQFEVLLAPDASEAQDWIVDDVDDVDEVEPGLPWETVSEAIGADDVLRSRRSARARELSEEEFSSESEEEDEANEEMEVEYESDGVEIIEQYGEDDNGASI